SVAARGIRPARGGEAQRLRGRGTGPGLARVSRRGGRDMRSATFTVTMFVVMGCGAAEPPPAAEDAQPIIGGETDSGDPGAVAVYAQQLGAMSGFLCTGSVIAPTVVLTAAHCVSPEETGANARFVVLTAADINRRGGQQLAVREVHANPRWSPDALENGHD